MRLAYQTARDAIGRNVKIQKKYYDRSSHLVKYKEGDAVMLKDFSPKIRGERKLAAKWMGPFFILDTLSDVNFRVIREPHEKPKVVHHDRLKPYFSREPLDVEWVLKRSKSYKSAGGKDNVVAPTPSSAASESSSSKMEVGAKTGAGRPSKKGCDPALQPKPANAPAPRRGRPPKTDPSVAARPRGRRKKEVASVEEPVSAPPAGRGRGRGRRPAQK